MTLGTFQKQVRNISIVTGGVRQLLLEGDPQRTG